MHRWAIPLAPLLVGVALATPPPAAAVTVPGPNGLIAFTRPDGQFRDIWVAEADGSNAVDITNTPDVDEGQPAWSPDGTRLVFARRDNATLGDIWTMDADGQNQVDLTNSEFVDEFQPDWSIDGSTIVYGMYDNVLSQFQLWHMSTDGTGQQVIVGGEAIGDTLEPHFSPDGTQLLYAGVRVFNEEGGAWEITTANPDGTAEQALTGEIAVEDRAPAWSPDGTLVTFMRARPDDGYIWHIVVMRRDGSGQTRLTADEGYETFPTFSPDGTQVLYSAGSPFDEDIRSVPVPELPAAAAALAPTVSLQNASSPAWAAAASRVKRAGTCPSSAGWTLAVRRVGGTLRVTLKLRGAAPGKSARVVLRHQGAVAQDVTLVADPRGRLAAKVAVPDARGLDSLSFRVRGPAADGCTGSLAL
jgi:TolB protein